MKIVEAIKFEGKNLDEIFKLPCVDGVVKGDNDKPMVFLKEKATKGRRICHVNDYICKFKSGLYQIFGSEAYQRLGQ